MVCDAARRQHGSDSDFLLVAIRRPALTNRILAEARPLVIREAADDCITDTAYDCSNRSSNNGTADSAWIVTGKVSQPAALAALIELEEEGLIRLTAKAALSMPGLPRSQRRVGRRFTVGRASHRAASPNADQLHGVKLVGVSMHDPSRQRSGSPWSRSCRAPIRSDVLLQFYFSVRT